VAESAGLAAVTGATGHLGNNLVRTLTAQGWRIRCLVMPGDDLRPLAGLAVDVHRGDVRDAAALAGLCTGVDVVFHLASLVTIIPGRSSRLEEINVGGARRVAESCLAAGVRRLVHTSSIHALAEPPPGTVIDEGQPFDPAVIGTAYGRSKAQGTLEVLSVARQGLDTVVVCPTGAIGPHDYRPSPLGQLMLDYARRLVPAYVDGAYDFVDVRDVVEGMVAASSRGRAGSAYILSGQRLTVRQVFRCLEELTGIDAPRLKVPAWCAYPAAAALTAYGRLTGARPLLTVDAVYTLNSNSHISSARAHQELGYRTRPVQEAIAAALAWFQDRGMLQSVARRPYRGQVAE
jgi:dihydroflavonol-4-reductase